MKERELPEGWEWKTVGDISDQIQYGYTESACSDKIGPKFLRITDIQNNMVGWPSVPYCKIDDDDKSKYQLNPGDLVFARTGATVGKSYLIPDNVPESVFASYLIRLILSNNINQKYVFYFFQSSFYWAQILKDQVGAGQPSFNSKKLSEILIPIPPLETQKKIVAILEMAERIQRLREEADALTEKLLQSVFLEMFGDPVTNQMGWETLTIKEISENFDGKRIPIKKEERATITKRFPYYGASGIIDYVDDFIFDGEYLLVAEDGANLLSRTLPIAFIAKGKFWANNHVHVIKPNNLISSNYLERYLNLIDLKEYITGSAQPKLNQSALNRIAITVPPISLQNQYDLIVNNLVKKKSLQINSSKEIEELKGISLSKAFTGELVS